MRLICYHPHFTKEETGSDRLSNLLSIIKSILVRNLMYVKFVEGVFVGAINLLDIRYFILARNPTNVRNVPKPSVVLPSFGHI